MPPGPDPFGGSHGIFQVLRGVGPGDEVITVPNTFIATAEAISFCGAVPVFIDIDELILNHPSIAKQIILSLAGRIASTTDAWWTTAHEGKP